MKKAGGIIALIAGIFGIFAAGATLFVGGLGGAFEAESAGTIVNLGWGGFLFSFLTIIFSAICMVVESKWPGIILIIVAVSGAVLGGLWVAIFMALALLGGILTLFNEKKSKVEESA